MEDQGGRLGNSRRQSHTGFITFRGIPTLLAHSHLRRLPERSPAFKLTHYPSCQGFVLFVSSLGIDNWFCLSLVTPTPPNDRGATIVGDREPRVQNKMDWVPNALEGSSGGVLNDIRVGTKVEPCLTVPSTAYSVPDVDSSLLL